MLNKEDNLKNKNKNNLKMYHNKIKKMVNKEVNKNKSKLKMKKMLYKKN